MERKSKIFLLQSYGGVEFEVILLTDIRDLDQVCRGPVQGFKVKMMILFIVHRPDERK